VDCGGTVCKACGTVKRCLVDKDCLSLNCNDTTRLCDESPNCSNGRVDPPETDVGGCPGSGCRDWVTLPQASLESQGSSPVCRCRCGITGACGPSLCGPSQSRCKPWSAGFVLGCSLTPCCSPQGVGCTSTLRQLRGAPSTLAEFTCSLARRLWRRQLQAGLRCWAEMPVEVGLQEHDLLSQPDMWPGAHCMQSMNGAASKSLAHYTTYLQGCLSHNEVCAGYQLGGGDAGACALGRYQLPVYATCL
jgi:hypothetical protein